LKRTKQKGYIFSWTHLLHWKR